LRCERLGDVALGNDSERDQQCTELFVRFLLQPKGALEARRIELAALDQDLADSLVCRCVQSYLNSCG